MREARRIMMAVALAAIAAFLLPFGARGDGFSSGSGSVTWPLQATTGLGSVAQFVGPTDSTAWFSASAGKNVSVSAGIESGGIVGVVHIDGGIKTTNSGTGAGGVFVSGGASNSTGAGGSGKGGDVTVAGGASGSGSASQSGGTVSLTGGQTNNNNAAGGPVNIAGGANAGSGAGGTVTFTPGMSTSGTDGSLILQGSSSHSASTVLTIAGTTATYATGTTLDLTNATVTKKYNCEAYLTADTTSVGNAANTDVNWTGETYDNGGLHDTSTNKNRFTAPVAGLYHFDAYLYFAANATGARNVQAIKNGSAGANSFIFNSEMTVDYSGVGRIMDLHFQVQLAQGDYIAFTVYQSSGGNLNLLGGATDGSGTNQATVSRVQVALMVGQ